MKVFVQCRRIKFEETGRVDVQRSREGKGGI